MEENMNNNINNNMNDSTDNDAKENINTINEEKYGVIARHEAIPVIAMRGVVVLPGESVTFDVDKPYNVRALKAALKSEKGVLLVSQKTSAKTGITWSDLYETGVYCPITQAIQIPDTEAMRVTLGKARRAVITDKLQSESYISANACEYDDGEYDKIKYEAYKRQIILELTEATTITAGRMNSEQVLRLAAVEPAGAFADAVAGRIVTRTEVRQEILDELDPMERVSMVFELMTEEMQILRIEHKLNMMAKKSLDRSQREYYLREKMNAIHEELGDDEQEEAMEFRRRMKHKKMPEYVKEKLTKEISRFESFPAASHESPATRAFIECVLDLPWTETTEDNLDIKRARKILERDHYGLAKVKERIIEYIAAANFSHKLNGQIICLVGPPGVGKTSIAKSIAEAVGRHFVRMSLGGINDESEIRGHRRTYVGAMPGKVISAMRQAGTINPVLLFDEIDKLSRGVQGDPAAAMLEVLDSAQNNAFCDHFLEIPYDLSKVMFITTANDKSAIPGPLLDRMEIIEVPGYLEHEKVQIAARHLLPRQLEKNGLSRGRFSVSEDKILTCITEYTRESGVRQLERVLDSLCRKAACEILEADKARITLTDKRLRKYLGAPIYSHEMGVHEPEIGVVNGLAWTSVGGELLTIEAQVLPGKGKLVLTGNLGDVMKESAQAALTYIRSRADEMGIDEDFFSNHDIHVHAPEGAVPKDGPSAGITLMTAITSAVTNVPVAGGIAMTGEITLRGRVMKIGGLREKLLAAIRAGLDHVIVPEENRTDVLEMEDEIKNSLRIDFVTDADQVRRIVFKSQHKTVKKIKEKSASRTNAQTVQTV